MYSYRVLVAAWLMYIQRTNQFRRWLPPGWTAVSVLRVSTGPNGTHCCKPTVKVIFLKGSTAPSGN